MRREGAKRGDPDEFTPLAHDPARRGLLFVTDPAARRVYRYGGPERGASSCDSGDRNPGVWARRGMVVLI